MASHLAALISRRGGGALDATVTEPMTDSALSPIYGDGLACVDPWLRNQAAAGKFCHSTSPPSPFPRPEVAGARLPDCRLIRAQLRPAQGAQHSRLLSTPGRRQLAQPPRTRTGLANSGSLPRDACAHGTAFLPQRLYLRPAAAAQVALSASRGRHDPLAESACRQNSREGSMFDPAWRGAGGTALRGLPPVAKHIINGVQARRCHRTRAALARPRSPRATPAAAYLHTHHNPLLTAPAPRPRRESAARFFVTDHQSSHRVLRWRRFCPSRAPPGTAPAPGS